MCFINLGRVVLLVDLHFVVKSPFLGYLQEEGLTATSQAFIHESPNLKEYADHTIGDGTIPACVFVSMQFFFLKAWFRHSHKHTDIISDLLFSTQSVFGKGLTTLLNEYVAARTKGAII